MSRSVKIYLQDIVEAIDAILEFTKGVPFAAFAVDEKLQAAVQFKLIVIGEAASKVPANIRKKFPSIEWKKVVGMRNIVAHGYFGVKLELIWDAITRSIIEIKSKLGDLSDLGDNGERKPP